MKKLIFCILCAILQISLFGQQVSSDTIYHKDSAGLKVCVYGIQSDDKKRMDITVGDNVLSTVTIFEEITKVIDAVAFENKYISVLMYGTHGIYYRIYAIEKQELVALVFGVVCGHHGRDPKKIQYISYDKIYIEKYLRNRSEETKKMLIEYDLEKQVEKRTILNEVGEPKK